MCASGQTTCEVQVQCGKGFKISVFTTSIKGKCEDCGAYSKDTATLNRYIDVPQHRTKACIEQETCGVGKKYVEPDGNRERVHAWSISTCSRPVRSTCLCTTQSVWPTASTIC